LLDRARERAAIWIAAPPGFGKTTLIASYLQATKVPAIWYQVDAGDVDPATFFAYLREAAPARSRAALPLLTPEYLADPLGFARRFFRELYARLPRRAVLVLDNYQEAAASAAFREITSVAASEARDGVTVLIASRDAPPREFARLQAARSVAALGSKDLELKPAETRAIAARRGIKDAAAVRALHARAAGWPAGLTLLLERVDDGGPHTLDWRESPQALFDYFAAEIFDRAAPELRTLWLSTAYLPQFDAAAAEALSGVPDAALQLAELARQHYFVERRAGQETWYQYHALFREFLLDRVQRLWSHAERQAFASRSAAHLEAQGDPAGAFALYAAANDWSSASRVVLMQAGALLGQGRWQTLHEWIRALPVVLVASVPWLTFWSGACQCYIDPAGGRSTLAHAFAGFRQQGDLVGQALSACAVLESNFAEWGNFAGRDEWRDALTDVLERGPAFPSPSIELRVWSGLMLVLAHTKPPHPLAERCVRRISDLCGAALPDGERLMAATPLLMYLVAVAPVEVTQAVVAQFGPLARSADTTPWQRTMWAYAFIMHCANVADFDVLLERNRSAQAMTAEVGLPRVVVSLRLFEVWGLLASQQLRLAHRRLDALAAEIDRALPNDMALHRFLLSWLALLEGRPQMACELAANAVAIVRELGSIGPMVSCCCAYSQALAECGESTAALAVAREATALVSTPFDGLLRFSALLNEADALRRVGERGAFLATLREAFATGRRAGLRNNIQWLPDMMSRLCAEALAADIETEYVEGLIEARRLPAPGPEVERWPWRVRVYTLGRFGLVIDGEPFVPTGKPQRRPLELLKALVAFGGRDVHGDALIEALWPDAASADTWKSLEITLQRLRSLLGDKEAIALRDGKLALDPQRCWVDVWAWERVANRAQRSLAGSAEQVDEAAITEALRLYQGAFLAGDAGGSVYLAMRERVRSRFLRLIRAAGQWAERSRRFEQAQLWYESALEIEPLAEQLYRALMTCLREQGRHAEALEVYRHCRRQLSAALGVPPSPATQAVHDSLRRRK
jgi:DNA-binding SARP family transcriptional activator